MFVRWLTVAGFILLRVSANDITFYSKCDSPTGEVTAVRVSNCDSSPCILLKGQEEYIEIEFKPKFDTSSMKIKVSAILVVEIPWNGLNPDACQGIQSCPLKAGQTYTYKTHMPVQTFYPEIAVTVKLQLSDSENRLVTCITIPMKIANKRNQTSSGSTLPAAQAPTVPALPGQVAVASPASPLYTGPTTSTVSANLFTTTTVASLPFNQNIPAAPVNPNNGTTNNQNNTGIAPPNLPSPPNPPSPPPTSPGNTTAAAAQQTTENCNAAPTLYSYSSLLFCSWMTALSLSQVQSWLLRR